jgi:hypothetical protein
MNIEERYLWIENSLLAPQTGGVEKIYVVYNTLGGLLLAGL